MSNLDFIALVIFLLPIMCMPSIIAFARKHHYKWVILAMNIALGASGIGYVIAFVWAVWPRQTAFFDVVANDPTTNAPEAGKKIYAQLGSNVKAYRDARDAETTASRYCMHCGNPLSLGGRFCERCGNAISSDT